MAKSIIPINYTSRDYDSIRQDLINYAKRYYPDTIQDFTSNSVNSFIFDAIAYVGDILSFYLDYQANESFLSTAIQYSNIVKLGEELGYKFANSTAASQGIVTLITTIPADNIGGLDLRYNPTLKKGSSFSSIDGKIFTLIDDVLMYDSKKSQITVNQIADDGTPIDYAVKNYGKVISGRLLQKTFSIGQFKKFLKINLEDSNVTEILSVSDSDGNIYYEVDYLSQNVVYKEMRNTSNDAEDVNSIMRIHTVPRRYITERTQNTTLLIFGGGNSTNETNYKDILTEPSTFILDIENKKYFSDKYFDPYTLTTSDKLGVGPANTTISVIYRVNTSDDVNVSTGFLTIVNSAIVEFKDPTILDQIEIANIKNNFEVENEQPIVGSVDLPSSEELKIRIKDNFSTQNRAVTLRDYESLSYSMPLKFGGIKRVRALKDIDSSRRNINLYILSEDTDGNFINSSDTLKNNLKIWLEQNKMIMDTIDIIDAKIINLKINYKIVGNSSFSKQDILFNSKQAIINLFDRKPEIGEYLLIGDIEKELRKLAEVSDIIDIEILQQTGLNYSNIYFNVDQNMSDDERYIKIPKNAVYEIKFPDIDITGVII